MSVLREPHPDFRSFSLESVVQAYENLLQAAPVGLTVVGAPGRVLFMNAFQDTLAGCPWTVDPTLNLTSNQAVPSALRGGLRRAFRTGPNAAPMRLAPFAFPPGRVLLETWLVPVREDTAVPAVVVLQHEQSAARVTFTPVRTREGRSTTLAPVPLALRGRPRLDLNLLRESFGLTERESQVVNALCRGLGTADIAQEMFISTYTVKDYLKRIQRKMGVTGRLAIAVTALTHHQTAS